MKTLGAIIIALSIFTLAANCPRDEHPERTPEPKPSCYTTDQGVRECGLQTGVQPAPSGR